MLLLQHKQTHTKAVGRVGCRVPGAGFLTAHGNQPVDMDATVAARFSNSCLQVVLLVLLTTLRLVSSSSSMIPSSPMSGVTTRRRDGAITCRMCTVSPAWGIQQHITICDRQFYKQCTSLHSRGYLCRLLVAIAAGLAACKMLHAAVLMPAGPHGPSMLYCRV